MSTATDQARQAVNRVDLADQAVILSLVAIAEALERIATVKEGEAARDGRPVIKRGRPRTASK